MAVRNRPRIGLTLMLDQPERDQHLPRYGMNRSYFDAIRRAGGVPVPLTPGDEEEIDLYLGAGAPLALDGVCLAGGGDLDPSYFGQQMRPGCLQPDSERDAMEIALLGRARDLDLPILAICRGIQVLNASWGGTLIQDIATERPDAQEHYFTMEKGFPRHHLAHEIRITPDCRLQGILGATRLHVNSIHHQAVDEVASGLVATAWAPDGIIEGLEIASPSDRFVVGVQFHPEDIQHLDPMRRLFQRFVERSRGGPTQRSAHRRS